MEEGGIAEGRARGADTEVCVLLVLLLLVVVVGKGVVDMGADSSCSLFPSEPFSIKSVYASRLGGRQSVDFMDHCLVSGERQEPKGESGKSCANSLGACRLQFTRVSMFDLLAPSHSIFSND